MILSAIKKTGLVLLAMVSMLPATVHAAGSNITSNAGVELVAIGVSKRLVPVLAGIGEHYTKFYYQRSGATRVTVVNVHGAVVGEMVKRGVAWQSMVPGIAAQRVLVKHGRHRYMPVWFAVERGWLATGWDIRALQIELERLGIKVKPKPAAPKPRSHHTG